MGDMDSKKHERVCKFMNVTGTVVFLREKMVCYLILPVEERRRNFCDPF